MSSSNMASGGVLSGKVFNKLQQNMTYRVESARSMIMGGGSSESVRPLQRRQQIRQNRMDLIGVALGSNNQSQNSTSSIESTSGNIGTSSTQMSNQQTQSVSSSTPDMSQVGMTTKERANQQSY